jgi:hypothetical protein
MSARPPRYAGRSYFADPGRLRASVEAFIEDAAQPALSGSLRALVVPHGTHGEIGPLAGRAYKLLLSLPLPSAPLLILAPAAEGDDSAIRCDPSFAYATPLGQVAIDNICLDAIEQAGLPVVRAPDGDPHIESHLPFVQVALGDEQIVPLRVSAGLDLAAPAWQSVGDQVGLIIAIANLPAADATSALMRLDERALIALPTHRRWLWGGPPAAPASPSADRAVLALAVKLAKAKGANRAALLEGAGARAALALYRA